MSEEVRGAVRVKLEYVRPTQRWINPVTFATPDGPRDIFSVLVDLLDDQDLEDPLGADFTLPLPLEAQEILREKISWPHIRVARRPAGAGDGDARLFCIDNKRLFMLNILGIGEVDVEEVKWTGEFDAKLLQQDPPSAGTQLKLRKWDGSSSVLVALGEEEEARERVLSMREALRKEEGMLCQEEEKDQEARASIAAAKLVVQRLQGQLGSLSLQRRKSVLDGLLDYELGANKDRSASVP